MKNLVPLFVFLTLSSSAFAATTPECTLYSPPNAPVQMQYVGESKISPNFPGSLVNEDEKTSKYLANGFSVELRTTNGCAESCWNFNEILVTRNGVSVFTFAEADKLESSSAVALYPTLTFIESGKELAVQCSYTPASK